MDEDEKLAEVPNEPAKKRLPPRPRKRKLKPKKDSLLGLKEYDRLRQHPVHEAEVVQVINFLNEHKKITPNDLPNILWVHGSVLKTNTQLKRKPGPQGRKLLYAVKDGQTLLVVPKERQEKYLRDQMLSPESTMPMTRDSGYHWLKKNTANISRRAFWSFLEKQAILQKTRNMPEERQKAGIARSKRGYCQMDLVHVNKDVLEQINEWFRGQLDELQEDEGEEETSKPAYFLTLTEELTGFSCIGFAAGKTAGIVLKSLKKQVRKMRNALGAPLIEISSDQGKEFLNNQVLTFLTSKHIDHFTVPRASRCEKVNQDYQRTFYRLMRLGRGSFKSCMKQAETLVNELFNKNLKCTSAEAVAKKDSELAPMHEDTRQKNKRFRGRTPKIGDKCRHLVNLRKLIRKPGFKTYKGAHFSARVYRVTNITTPTKPGMMPQYQVHGRWRDRDEIMLVTGVDDETDRIVRGRFA